MLHLRQVLRCQNNSFEAFLVQLVGGRSRGSSAEGGAHRDAVILVSDILVNYVVGKARERRAAAVEIGLHFVGGGVFFDFVKKSGGVVKVQHAALGICIFTQKIPIDPGKSSQSCWAQGHHCQFGASTDSSLVLFS